MIESASSSKVDNNDGARHRCCCDRVPIVPVAIFIGSFELFIAISNIVRLIVGHVQGLHVYRSGLLRALCANQWLEMITIIVVILLFVGIIQQCHIFVVPHLLFQTIGLILMVIGDLILIFIFCTGVLTTRNNEEKEENLILIGLILFVAVALFMFIIFSIWWYTVLLSLYSYLKVKQKSRHTSGRILAVNSNKQD